MDAVLFGYFQGGRETLRRFMCHPGFELRIVCVTVGFHFRVWDSAWLQSFPKLQLHYPRLSSGGDLKTHHRRIQSLPF